ncbi:MAG: aminoacyl-tRNA hydrolase [Candidatus Berkelbacteria bacterium]|nr:aminoacyl-tRNA hydrolase [Candidatus Berkelbacteria bacterium]
MKLIIGLGNTGKQYEGTRHNAGFMALDKLAMHREIASADVPLNFKKEDRFEAEIAIADFKGEKLILVKPSTFMNLSGRAVAKVMLYYKAEISDLIVISDDIDLPLGQARIRPEGSSGGQKGLQNVIDTLNTEKLLRVRIGIRANIGSEGNTINQDKIDTTNFVLDKFSKRELPIFDNIAAEVIEYLLLHLGQKHEIPAHTLEVGIE